MFNKKKNFFLEKEDNECTRMMKLSLETEKKQQGFL